MSESTVALIVIAHERRYQIESCHSADAYAMNETSPAKRITALNDAPGNSACAATYAVKMLSTTRYTNQRTISRVMFIGPPGVTVMITRGPRSTFALNSGDFISAMSDGRGTM